MIGVVLAAGAGRRLRPYTDTLPKALVPVRVPDDDGTGLTTPLDMILGTFAGSGITDVAIVIGFAADVVRERKPALEERYDLRLELIHNDQATTWNNCYSLWCARDLFGEGVLLSNGDTIHPPAVERALLGGGPPTAEAVTPAADPLVLLAVDTVKRLGEEEMKVTWSAARGVERITKLMDPAEAYGEYIGVCRLDPAAARPLADALEATWKKDPGLYYEDGFQELVDRGAAGQARPVEVAAIGDVPWIEIDDHADLARAPAIVSAIGSSTAPAAGSGGEAVPESLGGVGRNGGGSVGGEG